MKGRTRKKKLIFTGFGVFLLFLLAFAILFQRQFHTVVVRGDSMEPTLKPGQRLLFTNAYWLVGELRRQDIIVATDPEDPAQTVIKRIAGLAGDTIDPLNVPRSVSLQAANTKSPPGTSTSSATTTKSARTPASTAQSPSKTFWARLSSSTA